MRFVGIDVEAETIKLVELVHDARSLRWNRRRVVEHDKEPADRLRAAQGMELGSSIEFFNYRRAGDPVYCSRNTGFSGLDSEPCPPNHHPP